MAIAPKATIEQHNQYKWLLNVMFGKWLNGDALVNCK
jgi:hypothetical protein